MSQCNTHTDRFNKTQADRQTDGQPDKGRQWDLVQSGCTVPCTAVQWLVRCPLVVVLVRSWRRPLSAFRWRRPLERGASSQVSLLHAVTTTTRHQIVRPDRGQTSQRQSANQRTSVTVNHSLHDIPVTPTLQSQCTRCITAPCRRRSVAATHRETFCPVDSSSKTITREVADWTLCT